MKLTPDVIAVLHANLTWLPLHQDVKELREQTSACKRAPQEVLALSWSLGRIQLHKLLQLLLCTS